MQAIIYKPIGTVRSPFANVEGMPIQPKAASGIKGRIELDPNLEVGLKDLEGFSHIILIYHFHLSRRHSLEVKPFLDDTQRGVFATRVPARPNAIGLSVVKLTGISGSVLAIEEVDVIDGTPLLDIKPFVPDFDNHETQRAGWFAKQAARVTEVKADRRFASPRDEEGREPPGGWLLESRNQRREKILIVGCKRAMDDVCIGCSRCMVGFNRREGVFSRYEFGKAEVIGLLNCGDCPGATVVTRLSQAKLLKAPMGETTTKIHPGPCITDHCPHKETLLNKMRAKSGIEVIEGTHPYKLENIFV